MIYLLAFIIAVLSFILQVWPRLINRYFGVDTWRHLMYAEYVRKHKKLPESITDRYIVNGPFGYPPFIIIILSLFPKKFVDKYQFVFSPFFDAINNFVIFFAALYITRNAASAFFAQIIAATIPIIIMEASNLSTRSLSYLIFTLSLFPLLLFIYSGLLVWLFIAAVFLALLFYTHRFAIQAYALTIIGLSIGMKQPLYIVFFFIIAAIVYFTGGKLYRSVLAEHLGMLKYWRDNISLRFAHQFRGIPKTKTKDFVMNIYMLSVKNPFVSILGSNPWCGYYLFILTLFSFKFLSVFSPSHSAYFIEFQIWIVTLLVSALLILSVTPLRFLGEGHRYVEYATLPLAITLGSIYSILLQNYGKVVVMFFLLMVLINIAEILFLQNKTILHDRGRTISEDLWKIISILNSKSNVRLAIFPLSIGDAMMYFMKGRVLTSDNVFGLLQINDIYPMVTKPMVQIIKKYKVSHVLIDQKYISLKELKLKKYKLLFNRNDYVLIEV